ncbi:GNAT family N-acetyltransferase [Streptomyces sp. NPDC001985]|uniref:GNAT family N-acetyltransferase n=1 Tax=Streptomyces sp. NPDC001985 TaxID=3154406 RepID=UPI00332B69C7
MTTELRVLQGSEWDKWYAALELAFGGVAAPPERRELVRTITDLDRSLALWDGDACVGTAGSVGFRMTVPGGSGVPVAGVTMVSVAGTHRRRGLLTAMMRRQLDDIRAWGEPLAALTASEPGIYGRFGYGMATSQLKAEIDTARVGLTVPADTDTVRLRGTRPQDGLAEIEAVYARQVPGRPGMIARLPGWERFQILDTPADQAGASPLQCVLAERDGETLGYALFRLRPSWNDAGPDGSVEVQDLQAVEPGAYAALLRFLLGTDLTSRVSLGNRPADDAWQHLVTDVRRCGRRPWDGLHVRVVEVGAALAARTYRAPVDVVIEVEDAFCPWNSGRWRLSGDPKGASCERTTDAAELALTVRELGTAYLGGFSLRELAAAGRVREIAPGALAAASLAFGSEVAPWMAHGF